ncbi:MAG TPA: nuclear transport factor 2 family protein [Longimicrobiales bacterium]
MRRSLAVAATLLLSATPVAAQTSDEHAVLEVVQRLFDGMRAADTAVVRGVFHPEARLIRAGVRNGHPAVSVSAIDGFLAALGGATDVWDERLYDPAVRIDGNLASVWAEYTFHRGDDFSHCGVDAFQLVRTENGWKIISLADTMRREGCEPLLGREPWTLPGAASHDRH